MVAPPRAPVILADEPEPPVVALADGVPFSGRVVSVAGAPMGGVRIRLFDYSPHASGAFESTAAPRLVGATRTAESGRFAVSDRSGSRGPRSRFLLIERDGMRRTLHARRLEDAADIRLAPQRVVPIELHCDPLLAEVIFRPPHVVGLWQPGDDRWTSRSLTPEGYETPEPMFPGLNIRGTSVPPGTRRFSVDLTLPVGSSTLVFSGDCGFGTRVIAVTEGEGAIPPVHVTLPVPDAGALELRLTSASPGPSFSVDVWSEDHFSRRVGLSASESVLVPGLPPGEYHVGMQGRARCERVIALRSGGATRVDLEWPSCLVRQMRNHL